MTELEQRKDVLLRATLDILKKCDEGSYVKNVLEVTAKWDDTTCDGYCLMQEIEDLLEEVEESSSEHSRENLGYVVPDVIGDEFYQKTFEYDYTGFVEEGCYYYSDEIEEIVLCLGWDYHKMISSVRAVYKIKEGK
jgi:hypothetical protein